MCVPATCSDPCTLQSFWHAVLRAGRRVQGTSAFIGSAWATHYIGCKAAGISLLSPTKGLLMTGLVTLWGARLAGYLFYRVLVVGEDARLRQARALLSHLQCICLMCSCL